MQRSAEAAKQREEEAQQAIKQLREAQLIMAEYLLKQRISMAGIAKVIGLAEEIIKEITLN